VLQNGISVGFFGYDRNLARIAAKGAGAGLAAPLACREAVAQFSP
jgi:hypothetical protein